MCQFTSLLTEHFDFLVIVRQTRKGMLGYKEKLLFQEKKAFCLKFVNYLFIFFTGKTKSIC